jgi:hypothetical protein
LVFRSTNNSIISGLNMSSTLQVLTIFYYANPWFLLIFSTYLYLFCHKILLKKPTCKKKLIHNKMLPYFLPKPYLKIKQEEFKKFYLMSKSKLVVKLFTCLVLLSICPILLCLPKALTPNSLRTNFFKNNLSVDTQVGYMNNPWVWSLINLKFLTPRP